MKNKKINFFLYSIILCIILIIVIIINRRPKYNLNTKLSMYNIRKEKNIYIDYLKKYVKPEKLQKFVSNGFVNLSLYPDDATGNDVLKEVYYIGYELLFKSLFDKTRTSFDDCPVTDNFKNKFNTNLLDYYNLKRSDDAEVNCSLDMENKNFDLEVYGIIGRSLNLEPNYYDTHHFTYTLDADGNVDDIILNSNAY